MARQLRRSMAASGLGAPPRRSLLRPVPRLNLGRSGAGIGRWIGEIQSEITKVVWPTRREAFNLTALVIALSVAVGLLLGAIDYAFAELFRAMLR